MGYYSTISKGYNELYGKEQLAKLNFIKNLVSIKGLLLDIGCGTGLALDFFKVKSVGVDSSYSMLKKAKGVVINANAENLPFKDKSFNTVISITSIQNFKNSEQAIREMKRVCKGKIIVTIIKKSKKVVNIRYLIKKYFNDFKEYEQEKDIIFIIN